MGTSFGISAEKIILMQAYIIVKSLLFSEYDGFVSESWNVSYFVTPGYPYLADLSIRGEGNLYTEVASLNFSLGMSFENQVTHQSG